MNDLFALQSQEIMLGERLGLPPADLSLIPGFLSAGESDRLLGLFLGDVIPWRSETVTLFGKTHPVPRLTAWFGDPGAMYSYSGISQPPFPWFDELTDLRDRVAERVGTHFNSALFNRYRSGDDTVGWHSDDEPELGSEPVIASLSLGETRKFKVRRKTERAGSVDVDLMAGSLLIMRGNVQRDCEHSVPRTKRALGERVNLTFRLIRK